MLQLNEIGCYLVTDLSVIQDSCSGIPGVKCACPRAVLEVFSKGDEGA